jgi:hypothetical protein
VKPEWEMHPVQTDSSEICKINRRRSEKAVTGLEKAIKQFAYYGFVWRTFGGLSIEINIMS